MCSLVKLHPEEKIKKLVKMQRTKESDALGRERLNCNKKIGKKIFYLLLAIWKTSSYMTFKCAYSCCSFTSLSKGVSALEEENSNSPPSKVVIARSSVEIVLLSIGMLREASSESGRMEQNTFVTAPLKKEMHLRSCLLSTSQQLTVQSSEAAKRHCWSGAKQKELTLAL